jgi:hypothetical protein
MRGNQFQQQIRNGLNGLVNIHFSLLTKDAGKHFPGMELDSEKIPCRGPMNNKIIANLENPEKLEELYHLQKTQFKTWLIEAIEVVPTSETLKVWIARVNYSPVVNKEFDRKGLTLVIELSLLSFFLVKTPMFLSIPDEWFYTRFIPIILVSTLILYFIVNNPIGPLQRIFVSGGVFFSVLFMTFLPNEKSSATIIMSQIHMPLLLLSILAITFMSSSWKSSASRLKFIRYLGEAFIYGTIILLGGMVLTAITIGLFSLIGLSIEKWYMEYVVVLGLVATPIVASYLYDRVLDRTSKIATIIANTFSPLFLVTVVCYLIAMFFAQKNPYSDRDFLITFNGLLLLVWGITVFSIAGENENQESRVISIVNISLISTTLVINTIALSAILFRLIEYGVSPNRVVVIGSNVLIFMHLILILVAYARGIKNYQPEILINAIAKFLPIYTAWSLFVVAVLPFIFKFK